MHRTATLWSFMAAAATVAGCGDREPVAPSVPDLNGTVVLAPMEELGRAVFFDPALSINGKQSCASCHDPAWGWTGPQSAVNDAGAVYEGALPNRFGARKPPSSAYGAFGPVLYYDPTDDVYVGGSFWDGRATGWRLGDPAAEQALGPFLNPVEQGLHVPADVVKRICRAPYAALYEQVWGVPCDKMDPDAYDRIGLSIAAFERSAEVAPFSSKFDAWQAGTATLSDEELAGFELFVDPDRGKCVLCHVLDAGATPPLFTDFTFDNLGIPRNPANPFYAAPEAVNPQGAAWVDLGLGGFLASQSYANASDYDGMHKVPTLRNVDLRPAESDVKAYGHNGYFKSLWQFVHFYNTRDVKPTCPGDYTVAQALAADCWPAPEVADNVNDAELGDLELSFDEEMAIVAFLKTLSDGWMP